MHGVEMGPSKEDIIAGGVPNSVIRLVKALSLIEIKSAIITNDRKFGETGEKTVGFTLPWADVHLIRINGKYAGVKYSTEYLFKIITKIKQLDVNEKFDIIHGHSGYLGFAMITEAVSRLTGIPSIHTIYCPVKINSKVLPFYRYILQKKKIIAISDNVKYSLITIGIPSDRIEVIPPLIDFSIFKPNSSRENIRSIYGLNDEFTILYLGNLTKTKGIDVVLDALIMVKKQFSNIRFLSGLELTHSGTNKRKNEILNKIEAYNLTQNITELGLIKNVGNVMNAADVVVAPFQNTYEVADYPLVVLESMATGTPVITTMVGGIPEIVKNRENGIIINPDDPVALSHEIINLINNPRERKEIGERAAFFVRERFPEKAIVEMTKRVYEEVLYE
jgi:glycosyltransferase involved in cell wall biosynthesis